VFSVLRLQYRGSVSCWWIHRSITKQWRSFWEQ